ncbi:MAG: hypothetical protein K2H64_03540 [Desulfovibrio sp.]|nr:hypothetical protein [Desulfovibrio sp.]
MEIKKKILAVSCEMGRPAQATASVAYDKLFIMDISEAPGNYRDWLETAMEDMEKKTAAGWVVMVADRTRTFPSSATSWDMNAIVEGKKTNLQIALEMYFALQSRGAIIFEPPALKHQIQLGGDTGMTYLENDDRGRSVYRVNWANFSSAHLALLMCVAGAFKEDPLSERWMKVFAGTIKKADPPLVWPVFRAMREH